MIAPPSSAPLPLWARVIVSPLIVTGSGPSRLKTCVSPFPLIVVEAEPAPTMLTPPRTVITCFASTYGEELGGITTVSPLNALSSASRTEQSPSPPVHSSPEIGLSASVFTVRVVPARAWAARSRSMR